MNILGSIAKAGVAGFAFTLVYGACYAQDSDLIAARMTYSAYGCAQCHGNVGQGGAAGPRIAPDSLPYAAFRDVIRRPYGVMPAYSPRVLSREGLLQIYNYVQSIAPPPELKDIPALQLD